MQYLDASDQNNALGEGAESAVERPPVSKLKQDVESEAKEGRFDDADWLDVFG